MSPANDKPLDHCPSLRSLWMEQCAIGVARPDLLIDHASDHGCSPLMTEFYVADLQLLSAGDVAAVETALAQCVELAENIPDLRFFLVEDTLRLMSEVGGEAPDLIVRFVRRRQIELRRRWSTLPCRREYAGSTTLRCTD